MIRHAKQTGRRKLTKRLLLVALLLCPAVLRAQTNRLDTADPAEISAGTPGLGMTIFGSFPISGGPQTPICFFTVAGTSGTPLLPATGDSRSPTLVGLTIPAGSIQEIPASAFVKGVFNATVYATANASDTCDGKTIDFKYTNVRQIPIQEPAVLSTDLDTLTERNTSLGGNPAPREIYLQGTDFVPGEATVSFSGKTFDPFAGVVTVVSSISARVDMPAKFPASAKSVALTYCTHTGLADYCASPVTYPIQPLDSNPGTLTATPSPTAPTTPTTLQAVFGSTDGFGVPSGLVTFTDGTTTLGTAPLALASGQFVATNPPSAAPGDFEGPPQSILADLNQDGLQDVILYAPNSVQIYYAADNLGAFGFVTGQVGFNGVEFALDNDFCSSVVSVTTGDFNGDGYPDIAMLCNDPSGTSDNVLVYLNQQDGTFARESAIISAPSAHLIAAADFNHDGNVDILLVGPDGNTDLNGTPLLGFNIYPGDGFGDFGSSTPIDVPLGDGYQVAALDFNNDGFPDIALLYHDYRSDLSTSQIEVFQNDGTGNFPATATYSRSLGDTGATFQFFTPTLPGSKYPNLVAINGGIDAGIGVVFNNQTPDIGFSDTLYTAPVPGLLSAAMGDFNGDGFQDLAVYDGTNLSVYNAGPTGQYNQPLDSFTMPGGSINMLLGASDANGDGYSDPIAFIAPSDGPRLVQQYITSGTATAELDSLTFAAGSHSLTATTPGTPTISPGTASATLMSNGPTQIHVSNAVLTTSPTSPTTYAPSNPVTLTVEVDSLTAPAPTGLIQFINSLTNQTLGSASLTPASSTQSFASFPIGTLTAGNYSYSATYSGDTTYFGATIGAVGFQVNQATPVVGFVPNPATITFGTALSAAQLDATATLSGNTVAGNFVYTNSSGTVVNTTTVLPGGANNITATFTPTDTTDYKTPAGATGTITVNKATPVLAWTPTTPTITFGTALGAGQLNATAMSGGTTVAGTFTYKNASGTVVTTGTVLPDGPNALTASFVPTDTADYNTPTATPGATITVNKANASIGLTSITPPGNSTYSPTTNQTYIVNVAVAGTNPSPTGTVQVFEGVTILATGTLVPGPNGSSNATVSGSTPLTAGTHSLKVSYSGDGNYNSGNSTGISFYTVFQANPVVAWSPTTPDITFGTALGAGQLNATATVGGTAVAGTFTYKNASGTVVTTGTVLPAGADVLTVTFVPTDTTDYSTPAGVNATITVSNATPTVAWTPATPITYGTGLSAAQLDATAKFSGNAVAGVFTYKNASGTVVTTGTILPAGSNPLTVSFVPTDTADYNTPAPVNATIFVNMFDASVVETTSPAIPATFTPGGSEVLTATITGTGSVLPTGTVTFFDGSTNLGPKTVVAGSGAGTASLTSSAVLTAGSHLLTVSYSGDGNYEGQTSSPISYTIAKATPVLLWTPTTPDIPFGTPLGAGQLNATATVGGTAVAGAFTYKNASGTVVTTGTVLPAGSNVITATFTPSDTTDFNVPAGVSASITVSAATTTLAFVPNPATITFGAALSAAQLDATATFGGNPVAGTFAYTNASGKAVNTTTVLPGGPNQIIVNFTPTDTTSFTTPAAVTSTITVNKATPTVAWTAPAAIPFGTALSGTQLDATASFNGTAVAGTFSYSPAAGAVLTAGAHTLDVTFTPTDGTDFTVATGSTSITVVQSAPTITWATPAAISYGTALSGTQLNATAAFNGVAVAGTFLYKPAAGTVLSAGTNTLAVTFTPTDGTDFTVATGSTSITVGQSTPTITWATPAAIAYGTALSDTQLNATASFNGTAVAGTFSYNPASGAVLTAGIHTLGVTFTPTDTTDFAVVAGSVSITVGQSTPTITWANPAAIAYGTALSATQLNATASFNGTAVAGTFNYNPASGTVLTAGAHSLSVTFTPTDVTDFAVAMGSVNITVGQSTPNITWATPAAIAYGTALSATQLDATASFNGTAVAGTFSYNPASGAVLTAGSHTLGVTFTPTDTTDFTVATGSVNITVGQSTPTITWATPTTIAYGTALSGTQLNATATFNGTTVAGTFSYTPALGTVLTAGTHSLGVTFTPTDGTDFIVATGSVNITVGQSTPTITWVTPAAISYGTALSGTQLNATASFNGTAVAGTFSYTPASGTVLTAGTHTLGVTFTPTDTTDFAVATGSTSIAVGQDTPIITWATPAAINLGTALGATQLNATATGVGGAALSGTFTYLPAAGAILPVGANSLGLTFTPTDAVDYKTTAASVPLTVNPALTTTTVTSSANPAQFGQLVTFTVGVTSAYSGAAITGPVSVFDGATLLGTVQLPNLTVSTSALSAGTHNITAVYGGSANFGGSTSGILAETISSATTVITWPQPASVPYGTKLSATQLNATVSTAFAQTVPGTFTYTPAAGALLTAGSQTLSVLFTPTDTVSFKTATATVTLVITKVAPTLNWTAPANITAGTPLGATQLNATATDIASNPLPGVFTYTPASGTILAPGATTLSASFAPTDTVDYTTANISVTLNVDAAVTTVAVTSTANPSQFGQPIIFNVSITSVYTASPISGTVTISDGKTVLATPTLTNGAATFNTSALTAGAHNITASFAGNPVFAAGTSPALAQTVNLATTTITWPTPAGISYGTLLSATQLNATVATAYATTVPGTFVYTPAAGTLLTAGTQTLSVAFTPTDTVNFKPATGNVTIAVGKIAPTITWPTPADVVAGTTLSATQLNATATGISGALPGTFAYTPALGTVLTAGTQTLSVTFTPTDVTDYTTASATVPLNVIGLALTSLSTASVKLGDPALNLTLTGTGFLPNSVVYVGATALTTTFVNPTSLTVTIPASNFVTAQTLQITVNDPTQAQTSNALAIVVGAPPATITVNGPATVTPAAQPNLTFTITPYAVPITATLSLTFTPAPGLTTDGTILFPNGTTTTTFTIPANTATIPPVQFQSGSVAGTIVVTLKLTAGGVDVTPTPAPTLVITSPAATPGVAGVTLDRSGDTLTVTIQGYSNTRDIEQIHFHFVAAPGQSLATSDLVIDGTALFSAWYANPASPTYGSTFHYIQVFNLDQDATVVGQVQVTLVNSQGNSQTVSAQ